MRNAPHGVTATFEPCTCGSPGALPVLLVTVLPLPASRWTGESGSFGGWGAALGMACSGQSGLIVHLQIHSDFLAEIQDRQDLVSDISIHLCENNYTNTNLNHI